MWPPQKISETLRESRKLFEPEPSTRLMRLWKIMNGSLLTAVISLFISVSGLASLIGNLDAISAIYSVGFLSLVMPVVHLSTSRSHYIVVFETVEEVSEAIEKQLNPKQLQRMMKLTRALRILASMWFVNVCQSIVMLWAIPVWRRSLGAPIPFLPATPMHFWSIYLVESMVGAVGVFAVFSIILFTMQVSLCLTFMYDILGEQFRSVRNRESLYDLIRIHQLLLNASTIFKHVVSGILFNTILFTLCLVVVTTNVVISSCQIHWVCVMMFFFGTFFGPCVIGQWLATSSGRVGFMVYESDWVNFILSLRGDLSLVILRSKKTACIESVLFGNLDFRKITWFLENWYRLLQALRNLQ